MFNSFTFEKRLEEFKRMQSQQKKTKVNRKKHRNDMEHMVK